MTEQEIQLFNAEDAENAEMMHQEPDSAPSAISAFIYR